MVVALTGFSGLTVEHARSLIASSTTFQTWVGAANQAEAEDRVYIVSGPTDPTLLEAPYAVVGLNRESQHIRRTAAPNHRTVQGHLVCAFFDYVRDPLTPEDAFGEFWNTTDDMIRDVNVDAGTAADLLDFDDFTYDHPELMHPDKRPDAPGRPLQRYFAFEYDGGVL